MKIHWTRTAFERLTEINDNLTRESPDRAARWKASVLGAVDRLLDLPHLGTVVEETRPDASFREILLGAYRMIYRVDGLNIHIMTFRPAVAPEPAAGPDGGDEFPNG